MPRVMITKTLGRNIVAGTIKNLAGTVIKKLSEEYGDDWYEQPQGNPRKRFMMETASKTTKKGKAA